MASKGKSNNPPLGAIECEGCDGFATIRRRANGKRLLYTHCPNCGMNQMSGAKIQAKWEKAIGVTTADIPSLEKITVEKGAAESGEWIPPEVRNEIERINNEAKTKTNDSGANDSGTNTKRNGESAQRIENETDRTSGCAGKSSNGFGFFIFGAFAGLAAIAGIRR